MPALTLIGLTNPKSPTNVGAALRAAGCFQADTIYYTGDRFDQARKYHTDTKTISAKVSLVHVDDFYDHCPEGCKVVCVDLIEGAVPLADFIHPEQALYVFGPEDGSINQSVIDKADSVVYIPTIGCLNLAATVNVVLYDRSSKLNNLVVGDELVRSSRDRNNVTKVKLNDDSL